MTSTIAAQVAYMITEFDLPWGEAVTNVADENDLDWNTVADAAMAVRD